MEIHKPRSKTFVSMDSLWYEEERLATFIDWPVPFISCRELAREGFYYLRTKDHCACAFCRGIIGAWEEGDTPRGEHKRHFPDCPFVQGKVTPNVPLTQGNILARVSREITLDLNTSSQGFDVCGSGKKEDNFELCPESRLLTKPLNSSTEISMSSFGFRQYCGPKRKEYLTADSRLNSFKHWPEKVKQTPEDLSEAGFYYCGLSDHVRCFHCGNGLRNWEPEDKPWEEHARWFPDCHYVVLKKGICFVDKIRREKPPYIPTRTKQPSNSKSSSEEDPFELSDDEMEKLMELQIMKHVSGMGFTETVVKKALKKKLLESGQPFFSVGACIDAILSVLEEETSNTIHGCEDITSQARKLSSLDSSLQSRCASESLPSQPPSLPARANPSSESVSIPTPLPPLPNNNLRPSSPSPLPPLPNLSGISPPLRSSTPTSQVERSNTSQSMELEAGSEPASVPCPNEPETANGGSAELVTRDQSNRSAERRSGDESPMELPSEVAPLFTEADDIMEEAAKLLAPSPLLQSTSSSSSPSRFVQEEQKTSVLIKTDKEINSEVIRTAVPEPQTENLALELERMRENQMCRVCMDKKMTVVFLPCTHMVTCSSCAVALTACPICRRDIKYAIKPIIS